MLQLKRREGEGGRRGRKKKEEGKRKTVKFGGVWRAINVCGELVNRTDKAHAAAHADLHSQVKSKRRTDDRRLVVNKDDDGLISSTPCASHRLLSSLSL